MEDGRSRLWEGRGWSEAQTLITLTASAGRSEGCLEARCASVRGIAAPIGRAKIPSGNVSHERRDRIFYRLQIIDSESLERTEMHRRTAGEPTIQSDLSRRRRGSSRHSIRRWGRALAELPDLGDRVTPKLGR